MKKTNFPNLQDQWKATIAEQKASGLSQSEFCKRQGISISAFYSWTARLKKLDPAGNKFIRVKETKASEPLRIEFKGGVVLHLTQTPDPEWIAEIMRLVS